MKKLIPMPTLRMRTHALAAAAVAAFLFAPASAFSQVTLGPGGVTIGPGYQGPGYGPGYGGGGYGPRYGVVATIVRGGDSNAPPKDGVVTASRALWRDGRRYGPRRDGPI